MVAPRRVKQQRLANGVPAFALAVEQQPADGLGARRTAGFPSSDRGDPDTAKRLDEQPGLGRLAGPLPAFDGDELAARGQWVPQIR